MTAQYQRNVDWWRPTGNYYLIIRSGLLSGCTFWCLLPDFWTNGMWISCLVKSKYIGTITWLRRVSAPEVNIRSQAVKTTETNFDGILRVSFRSNPLLLRACHDASYKRHRNLKHPSTINLVSRRKCRDCRAYQTKRTRPKLAWRIYHHRRNSWFKTYSTRFVAANNGGYHFDNRSKKCALQFTGQRNRNRSPWPWLSIQSLVKGRRGITAWVERPGPLSLGDAVHLLIPTQPQWQPKQQAHELIKH